MMPTILTTYLNKNIMVVFLAIFFIIVFLILGNSFTLVLNSSLDQNLDILSIFSLVFIKSLREIPLIITLSFFIATIVSINKMYKDSEIYAIYSTGIGELKLLQKLIPSIIFITGISFYISMFLVPQANILKEQIIQKNANTSEFHFIKTEQFQSFQGGNITLYAKGNTKGELGNIFLYSNENNVKNIILAENAYRYQDGANNVYIRLQNGSKYDGFLAEQDKKIFDFKNMDIKIFDKKNKDNDIRIDTNAKSLHTLLSDLNNQNIAEIWWRISLPISAIILAIIGVFLAKSPPRGGKNLGVLYGVLMFAFYLSFLKSSKDSIIQNVDIWHIILPHLVFIILAILLYFKNNKFTT